MKKQILALGMLVSTVFAFGADINVTQSASAIRVTSALVKAEGQGFPQYRVTATATFSNSCVAPRESEVLKIVEYRDSYDSLVITVAELNSQRACPAIYAPVTRTFDLGLFTKPNDGSFKSIVVNGKKANYVKLVNGEEVN